MRQRELLGVGRVLGLGGRRSEGLDLMEDGEVSTDRLLPDADLVAELTETAPGCRERARG